MADTQKGRGDPAAAYGQPHGSLDRYQRVASNCGPIWPVSGAMIVEIVESGTEILGRDDVSRLTVDDDHVVQKGDVLFVTRPTWDAILARKDVRQA